MRASNEIPSPCLLRVTWNVEIHIFVTWTWRSATFHKLFPSFLSRIFFSIYLLLHLFIFLITVMAASHYITSFSFSSSSFWVHSPIVYATHVSTSPYFFENVPYFEHLNMCSLPFSSPSFGQLNFFFFSLGIPIPLGSYHLFLLWILQSFHLHRPKHKLQ